MLKLNVGFNRKTGEPNYGSRGASVNLELELDSGLVGDPERLKDRIRQLFELAKLSVNDELAVSPGGRANGHPDNGAPPNQGASRNNGASRGNGAPHGNAATPPRDNTRRATANQVRALRAIAERLGIELADELRATFGVNELEELSITEASQLIDELKGQTNGDGGRR